ncbi:MAG: oligopeptide:H+ symporter [Gammaproteobacteria bacterium]|nr:oligopeptide:H+ symporter [Gammaproteobacteria bacterium]
MIQKQPKALTVFFMAEMCERYGFYIILSLVIFYLTDNFHLSDGLSYEILGSITALAYANSILGGFIADRLIGPRAAVISSFIILTIGYALAAVFHDLTFVLADFAMITVGVGLMKPNISSMVGFLYPANDTRRYSGYTVFFMGINIGIILGETVAGIIQKYLSWHGVFFSASFALVTGFLLFLFGSRTTTFYNDAPHSPLQLSINYIYALSLVILAVFASYFIISHQECASNFFICVAISCFAIMAYEFYNCDNALRLKLIIFLILMIISTCYWMLYFQMFFSMNLFVERVVDNHIWGISIIPTVYPAIEAVSVVIIGFLFAWGWRWLEEFAPSLNPSIPMKFTLALLLHSIALGLLYYNVFVMKHGLIRPADIIPTYVLIAVGELLISPIGLAMVGELLPRRLIGLMTGIFFITQGLGAKLSGMLANFSAVPVALLNNFSAVEKIYQRGFKMYLLISVIVTFSSLLLVPILKKYIDSLRKQRVDALKFKQKNSAIQT